VERAGGTPLAIPVDVADAEAVEAAAERVERDLGLIDVWVNNAFASVFAPFEEISADEFRRVTEVCYLGFVNGTRSALARMRPRDRGVVVQVGSALGERSIPLQSAYCGAKHAIRGFMDSIRSELIHNKSNVKLTAVHMPALNTRQFDWVLNRMPRKPQPVPPIFQPEVGARAVYHAAHHPRREYYVGRSSVQAIVGNKVAPELLDEYLARTCYEAQQYDGADDPNRKNNLWEPIPGDHGAHGDFDARASERSPQLWLDTHRKWVAMGLAAAGIVGAVAAKKAA
ncbi:MAG TPA: SDR family oxidoreductase, partial [Terriglobales bacterium]|nr:SDR family oxidoreductase [Terriglobales bacterium]